MTKYAEGTSVSIASSRTEIERTLARYQATGFLYGTQGDRAMIAFELGGRRYRMELRYPHLDSFRYTKMMARRSATSQKQAYEQEQRRLWRSLAMILKAKLEAVASGVSTLSIELMPYTVMPNNQTVGEWLEPQLEQVYQSGQMPPMLPWGHGQKRIDAPYLDGELIKE